MEEPGFDEIEALNPLQIFLLVLVDFGLATPYDLLSKAGLGPGLTSPSLKRLERAGLLSSTPGPRSRLRYEITSKGLFELGESLKPFDNSYWKAGTADTFDSLPRGIVLAWLHFGVEEARDGIARARENLSVVAQKRLRDSEDLHEDMLRQKAAMVKGDTAVDKGTLIATAYQWLKADADATLFRLQVESLQHVNQLLADLPPAPKLPQH